jgi:hypothetical protein
MMWVAFGAIGLVMGTIVLLVVLRKRATLDLAVSAKWVAQHRADEQ